MKFLRLFETPVRFELKGDYAGECEVHAWVGNQHVGVATFDHGAISYIFVHPEFRRQGIAQGMVATFREPYGDYPIDYGDTSPSGREFLSGMPEDWFYRDPLGDNRDNNHSYGDDCPTCHKPGHTAR